MKYIFFAAWLLAVICLTPLIRSMASVNDRESRVAAGRENTTRQVVVHAAGRGNPYVNFEDGVELTADYESAFEMQGLLKENAVEPRALASGDFDEDGVPDLVCGYARAGGGIVTLYRGNIDSIFQNSPEAQRRKAEGTFSDSPFLSPMRVFDAPISADFVGAGDFDADGHWDVVIAARGGDALYLLPGDGGGALLDARSIALPGTVKALVTGEMNRADGLTDLVIGIVSEESPGLLIFEGPEGALKAAPEVFSLPGEPSALALGQFDSEYTMDLAVGVGSELVVIHGRDRRLSLDQARKASVAPARVDRLLYAFEIRSLTVGDFAAKNETSLALLGPDGTVYLTSAQAQSETTKGSKKKRRQASAEAVAQFPGAEHLVCARVSTGPADDLVILNKERHLIQILKTGVSSPMEVAPSAAVRVSTSLDLESAPVAVLPARLNADALSDLVVLQGDGAPAILKTAAAQTFTVNNADDHDNGICDSGDCTLREAINAANANPGADNITFNIVGGGVQTISTATALPQITDPTSIDGTTQPGYSGTPLIELNGANAASFSYGLDLSGGSSTVRGLAINRFFGSGILLSTHGNNKIEGNLLGTDVTGTISLGNAGSGVLVQSPLNTVGGTTAEARNVISGNGNVGVSIAATSSLGNQVQGNFIGTDFTGTASLGNQLDGVNVAFLMNNTVGGAVAGARNIISGNGGSGIRIGVSAGNQVLGNFIGTDVTGTVRLSNRLDGIGIFSPSNTIGGTSPGQGNVISGNNLNGIVISDSGNIDNQVQGNFIGTDKSGGAKLGNVRSGVSVSFAWNTIVGGAVAGARNVISGNGWTGITVVGGSIATPASSLIQGNFIGTDVTGSVNLGNALSGVEASGASIGGSGTGAGNIIAFNGGNGVTISFGPGNALHRNSIFSNVGLGIDLGANIVTNNDSCDADTGPNNLQNFPVLTSATSQLISTTVRGTLNSTPNTSFTIEFFGNPACDSSGFGEGQMFVGATAVTTDGNCNATFDLTFPVGLAAGQFITATATDSAGNTSEFSQCVQVQGPSFDLCLQDETNGSLLLLNTATGEYQFTNCRATNLSGIGSVMTKGCLVTMQVNGPDRRILVRIDTCSKTGNASIQLLSQGTSFSILDRNTSNNTCSCTGPG